MEQMSDEEKKEFAQQFLANFPGGLDASIPGETGSLFDFEKIEDEEEDEVVEDPVSEFCYFSFSQEDRLLFAYMGTQLRNHIGNSSPSGFELHQLGIVLNILERFPISESWYSASISTPDIGSGTSSISIEGDTIRLSRTYINQSNHGSDSESSVVYEVGVGWREVDDYSEVRDFIAEIFSEQTLEIYAEDPPGWDFELIPDAWNIAFSKSEQQSSYF